MSETYETYEPPAGTTKGPEDGEQWSVIVEYANRGDAKPPTRLVVLSEGFASRSEAMAEAARQAFEYRPPDPMSPRGRQVFEITDGYLAVIDGAMSTFHISLRAARVVGEAHV